jgi:UDP-N-acetylglucosamine 1-carboxyvinyltransferase
LIGEQQNLIVRRSRLAGQVALSGAKNSALRLLVASLLTSEKVEIENFPAGISDGRIQIDMLRMLGKQCDVSDDRVTIVDGASLGSRVEWHGRSIRNTLLVLGALTARTGNAAVPLPGGCKLGERKYDLHQMLLKQMGADVWTEGNMLLASAPKGLHGADIHLPIRSTGATENAILCGTLARGTTRIWNPHTRPEILDLIALLKKMGASIEVFGQEHICIKGQEALSGARHRVVADNMEALTWFIGSVITGGDVEIIGFPFDHLEVPMVFLRESGARFYRGDDRLIVRGGCCYPIDISTGPYPGINSDMQPLFAVFGLCAKGESRIVDLRFPGRYHYADEMAKMGGNLRTNGDMLYIQGGNPLFGARVRATDLRAGIALTFAGLVADGETQVEDAWQITRGYNGFKDKLAQLGGDFNLENAGD